VPTVPGYVFRGALEKNLGPQRYLSQFLKFPECIQFVTCASYIAQ